MAAAGWKTNRKSDDMVKGLSVSQKSVLDLMQNCDLPPPLKVVAGLEKTLLLSMNSNLAMTFQEEDEDLHTCRSAENEKLELLRALRRSQTRAMEAERKTATLVRERDTICRALLAESSRLFAYRQWVKLLELQLLKLKSHQKEQQSCDGGYKYYRSTVSKKEDVSEGEGSTTWLVALTLCLGLALGCRYWF